MKKVLLAVENDIEPLKKLFCDAFDEDYSSASSFYENGVSPSDILVAHCDDTPCGMLQLLPAVIRYKGSEYKSGYIYALAVDEKYRHRGFMTALLSAAASYAKEQEMGTLFLVPQTRALFSMYEKLGYRTVAYKEETVISPAYVESFSITNCERDVFFARRAAFLTRYATSMDLCSLAKEYQFQSGQEFGDVLFYRDNLSTGYVVGVTKNNRYHIKNTDLPLEAVSRFAYAIKNMRGQIKTVTAAISGRREPFAMAKSLDGRLNLFDLKLSNPHCSLMLE